MQCFNFVLMAKLLGHASLLMRSIYLLLVITFTMLLPTEVLNASTIIASPISSLVVPALIPVKIRLAATLRMIDPCYIREANR